MNSLEDINNFFFPVQILTPKVLANSSPGPGPPCGQPAWGGSVELWQPWDKVGDGRRYPETYQRPQDSVRISIMTRQVLLYPGEDGFMVAEVPSLPGCVSQGRTREEALENVREAISLHEEVLRERGEPIPEDRVELVEVAA